MYTYRAEVVKIIDGDTLDVDIDLGFYLKTRQRLRLAGIDTPEKGYDGFIEATDRVKELCPVGTQVMVSTEKTGSFGRWIAEVSFTYGGAEVNLSNQLLMEGLAKPYIK